MFHHRVSYHALKGEMSDQKVSNHHVKVQCPIIKVPNHIQWVLGHLNKGVMSS